MADKVTTDVRSRNMAAIRHQNTKPEMLIRCGLHAAGFRFRLHDKRLPGRPDLVFPRYRAAIQVHGCYWHGHSCAVGYLPSSRLDYWGPKIERNQERDEQNHANLSELGWRVLTVWECAMRGRGRWPIDELLAQCSNWIRAGDGHKVISGRHLS